MTITEFLLARIAEDEANVTQPFGSWTQRGGIEWGDVGAISEVLMIGEERLLAECEAKRALLIELTRMETDEVGWDGIEHKVMCYLALPYADHPDYDQAWRP